MCSCGDGCMGCLLHKSPCRCGCTRKYFVCYVRDPWNDAVLCLSRSLMRLRHAETWQYRLRLEVRRQQRRKKRAVDTAAATAAATATTVIASVRAHRCRWSMTSCSLSLQPHNIVLRATHLRQAPTSVVRRQWCRLMVAWPTSRSSCCPSCRQERSMAWWQSIQGATTRRGRSTVGWQGWFAAPISPPTRQTRWCGLERTAPTCPSPHHTAGPRGSVPRIRTSGGA